MTDGPCITDIEYGNLLTVNDSYGPPIPYMECGNLVTLNDIWSFNTLYGMQEPCNGVPPHVQCDLNVGTL